MQNVFMAAKLSPAELGLPKSSGLTRRPFLLCQDHVTAELNNVAQSVPRKIHETGDHGDTKQQPWGTHYTPYTIDFPPSLWHRPPAPG